MRLIINISLGLVFVISTIFGLVGTVRLADFLVKAYWFGIENCSYPYSVYPEVRESGSTPQKAVCEPIAKDNYAKENAAEGLAMMVPAAALSFFAYRGMRKRDDS